MTKTRLIAQREYLYYVRKRSFQFVAFGIPMIIMIGFAIIIALIVNYVNEVDTSGNIHYGYVDNAPGGVILEEVAQDLHNHLFWRYEDEISARAALDDEIIPAYIVVTEDYMDTGDVKVYSYSDVPEDFGYYVDELLISSISAAIEGVDVPVDRVINPTDLTIRMEDSGRELTQNAFIPLIVTPIAFAALFVIASQMTGGYLMSGLVEEKTNHIMEILVTSVTPMQLMAGKIIGLGLLGLTQLAAWVGVGVALFIFGTEMDLLEDAIFPVDLLIVAFVYFLLDYALSASVMVGLGSVVGSEQESRQYAGIFSMLGAIPFFSIVSFLTNPNGTIPVILSLVPFTAPVAMVMRAGLTSVPLWQIALSTGILLLTLILFVWIAAGIFRWSMLLYGKKTSPRDLIRILRGNVDAGTPTTDSKAAKREVTS